MKRLNPILFLFGIAVMTLALNAISTTAFADDRRGGDHRGGRRESVSYRGERYDYHEGRFYRPSLFGLFLDLVLPPRGVVVTYLPYGYRTVIVGRTTYYEYENIYYQPCSGGYTVVQAPVVTQEYVSPNVVYAPSPYVATTPQYQTSGGDPITVNVRTNYRGTIAITLMRYPNGFVGPQGEFYSSFPSSEELRARYGQ